MKVALISHEGGGTASVCYGLGQSLAKKKINTTIFTGTPKRVQQIEKLNDYLEIIRMPILNFPPRALWFQVLHIRKLLNLLKDYTVIHGVSPDASFVLAFYKKKLRKPFVATIHGSIRAMQKAFVNTPVSCWTRGDFGFHVIEFPLHDYTISKILSGSDHIAVCSFTVLEELKIYRSLDVKKATVIYNGINLDEIENTKASSTNKEDDLSIIYAGRLFWTKGAIFLLKALQILRQDFKNVHLKIFGSGPLENRIREFVADADLRDCVSFRGHVSHKNLLAEVKTADLVVHPSIYEAQPMFALEAMACRKPVVVFDAPWGRELISNKNNGLLARMCDVKDLSNKIQLLLLDRKLRTKLGENAYNYVKQKHNWDIQVQKYLRMYEEVK